MAFTRGFDAAAINHFKETSLFLEKLLPDFTAQNVFLAIRDGQTFDIYHKGGKLFSYHNGFSTHIKYASILTYKDDYIPESVLTNPEQRNTLLVTDFNNGYKRIKENCALHSGPEAAGVSNIYSKYSYLSNSPIVVLDIEVSFEVLPGTEGIQDRIDILLFNKETRQLKFVEAKEFSNKEIWSQRGTRPQVITDQLPRYEAQIINKEADIVSAYTNAVNSINNIFNIQLPTPLTVVHDPTLLIFGFDANQRDGRLNDIFLTDGSRRKENGTDQRFPCYCIGDIKRLEIQNLWNAD